MQQPAIHTTTCTALGALTLARSSSDPHSIPTTTQSLCSTISSRSLDATTAVAVATAWPIATATSATLAAHTDLAAAAASFASAAHLP